MAVFTELTSEALFQLGEAYGIDNASSIIGLADGDLETTYLLLAGDQQIVVTIFESHIEPFDVELAFLAMEALSAANVPCPKTIRTFEGDASTSIAGHLFALVEAVPGTSRHTANSAQCRSLGREVGKLHKALSERFPVRFPQRDGLLWGWVHGGLKPENVFFVADDVTGIINFRLRHQGYLLEEIAAVIATWCMPFGRLELELTSALLTSYESTRPLYALERSRLPLFVLAAISRKHALMQGEAASTDAAVWFKQILEVLR